MVDICLSRNDKNTMESLMLVVLLHVWVPTDIAFLSGFSL